MLALCLLNRILKRSGGDYGKRIMLQEGGPGYGDRIVKRNGGPGYGYRIMKRESDPVRDFGAYAEELSGNMEVADHESVSKNVFTNLFYTRIILFSATH
jgi:hypothetical protein